MENTHENSYQELIEFLGPKFEKIDNRFGQIDAKFGKIDARFEKIDGQFGMVVGELIEIKQTLGTKADKADVRAIMGNLDRYAKD